MRIIPRLTRKECFVSDLTWHVLDPFGKTIFGHEQIDNLIAEGYKYHVKIKNKNDTNVGVGRYADLEPFAGQKLFSIAALVASDEQTKGGTTLYLFTNPDLDDGSGFAVAMIDGNIYFDISFELENLEDIFGNYKQACDKLAKNYRVIGDVQISYCEVQFFELKTLLQKKSAKYVLIKNFKNERLQKSAAFAIAIAFIGCVFWLAYDYYVSTKKNKLQMLQMLNNTPSVRYATELPEFMNKERVMIGATGQSLFDEVNKLPVFVSGWVLSKLSCQSILCKGEWRSNGGDYKQFQKSISLDWKDCDAGTRGNPLADLKTFQCTISLNVKKAKILPIDQLPELRSFKYDIGVLWQNNLSAGMVVLLSDPEIQGLPQDVNKLEIEDNANVLKGMNWSISGIDWQQAQDILKKYPHNMELSFFELTIDVDRRSIGFSGKGVAYVK